MKWVRVISPFGGEIKGMKIGNATIEQMENGILYIELDNRYAHATGGKLLMKIGFREKDKTKEYKISRTSKGGHIMQ